MVGVYFKLKSLYYVVQKISSIVVLIGEVSDIVIASRSMKIDLQDKQS